MARLTEMPAVPNPIPGPATFFRPSADSRRAVFSYWRKLVHKVLGNHLGGISLPRKIVVRLNDRPAITKAVYRGRKITTQQQQQRLRNIFC